MIKTVFASFTLLMTVMFTLLGTLLPLAKLQYEFAVAGIVIFAVLSFFLLLSVFMEDF